jgi:hypothetical protein
VCMARSIRVPEAGDSDGTARYSHKGKVMMETIIEASIVQMVILGFSILI